MSSWPRCRSGAASCCYPMFGGGRLADADPDVPGPLIGPFSDEKAELEGAMEVEIDRLAADGPRRPRGDPAYQVPAAAWGRPGPGEGANPPAASVRRRPVFPTRGPAAARSREPADRGDAAVARLHFRGHVNRLLRGLVLARADVPGGAALWTAEKQVGDVRSVVTSPRLGPIGLAMVRREVPPGDALEARFSEQRAQARVVELPFA